jgi:putative transposase
VRQRVARSRELVAEGYRPSAVARVAKISRQALYRRPRPRAAPQRRPPRGPVEEAIVEVAKQNPTDGYRMVWALTRRKLGVAVNRKRVLRVMREQGLIQRRRSVPRRRRPGFFRVERPGQLWHMDMTSIWVAEQGWCYLNAIIDCCTRELVGACAFFCVSVGVRCCRGCGLRSGCAGRPSRSSSCNRFSMRFSRVGSRARSV